MFARRAGQFVAAKYRVLSPIVTGRPALPIRMHSTGPKGPKDCIVQWVYKTGQVKETPCSEGETLLEVARAHEVPVEGACEGACKCSTCHVILTQQEQYDHLADSQPASETEDDQLDQALFLTPTSRLGCQIRVQPGLSPLVVKLPAGTRNWIQAEPH
eukprot:TRINITY_DN75409_c0_g1_i1.p1 TRINITY_DN75409_c0_g1~~TRINITY_DN75409_c0_g1_i1.p1  ORF type:complete len:167 (+),score=10.56 TRINITY_DN75409_c0_g1_i1:30-503(+)